MLQVVKKIKKKKHYCEMAVILAGRLSQDRSPRIRACS